MKIIIAIILAVVALGAIFIYVRNSGSVAGAETIQEVSDTDFSQLDETLSGL
jgi:hypothetical protein